MSSSQDHTDAVRESCRETALNLLSRKPHSTNDLRKKLRSRRFPQQAVEDVVADFQRTHLLDDLTLACDYCEFRRQSSPPVGRLRAEQDLRKHGLDTEIVDRALREVWDADGEDGERQRAFAAAETKRRLLARESDPRKAKMKMLRFLAGRGFAPAICRDVADAVMGDEMRAD